MIRVALVAALAGLSAPSHAQDDIVPALCGEVLTRLAEITAPVFALSAKATPTNMVGCLYTDLRIDMPGQYVPDWFADSLHLNGSLQWIADGSSPPDRLGVGLTNLRAVIQTGDPQSDFLYAAQSRPNGARLNLDLAWDAAANALAVEQLVVDFPGENLITLSLLMSGVDLSSPGAMQMSTTSFALSEADLKIQTHGLFEWYALVALGTAVLPRDGDIEAAAQRLREDAMEAVGALPEAQFVGESKAALAALIAELPNPAGTLTLALRADPGFGPTRFAGYALTGAPDTIEAAAPLLDGVRIEIGWTHEESR